MIRSNLSSVSVLLFLFILTRLIIINNYSSRPSASFIFGFAFDITSTITCTLVVLVHLNGVPVLFLVVLAQHVPVNVGVFYISLGIPNSSEARRQHNA